MRVPVIGAITVGLMAATAAVAGTPSPTPTPGPDVLPGDADILLPESGVLHGVFLPGHPLVTPEDVDEYADMVGLRPAIQLLFFDWTYRTWDEVERQIEAGAPDMTYVVTWEPRVFPNSNVLNDIASGSQDRIIRYFAEGARDYGEPIFLRFGHEMNGDWYPWSGAWNGREPERYITAWRHVHDIFNEVGADNVIWVWAPNAWSVPNEPWNALENYYPGDEYVDWVGVDFYGLMAGWGRNDPGPAIDRVYRLYGDRKPIMIAETAAADSTHSDPAYGMTRAEWINALFDAIEARPNVRAFIWFNIDKEADWRVEADPESLATFRDRLLGGPYLDSAPTGAQE